MLFTHFLHSEHNCSNGDLRLVGGLVDSEGIVEMCQDGAWNSLCSSNWGNKETVMVCKQLQLPTDGKTDRFYHLQYNSDPIINYMYLFTYIISLNECYPQEITTTVHA